MIIYNTNEIEEQRYGRNKNTTINHGYINSGEYRNKFDLISGNLELNRLIYQLSKRMLKHRSGTLYEDMYWIDLDTLKVVAKETDANIEEEIKYSNRTPKAVKAYDNLITIHSHPNSFPPSIADINSNFNNGYVTGIIICHDGTIYLYRANEIVSEKYYQLTVAEYQNQGYNDNEAQKLALEEMRTKFDIEFKEVTGNDV